MKMLLALVAFYYICIAINSSNQSQSWVFETQMRQATIMPLLQLINQSIKQLTFPVIRTHPESQQTIHGKTEFTKHSIVSTSTFGTWPPRDDIMPQMHCKQFVNHLGDKSRADVSIPHSPCCSTVEENQHDNAVDKSFKSTPLRIRRWRVSLAGRHSLAAASLCVI